MQGKASHLEDLLIEEVNPSEEYDVSWTCPAQVKSGDLMVIYLMAPLSAMVGVAFFDGEPFINNDLESEWIGKRMCVYRRLMMFKPENHIKLKELRDLFPDWFWVFRPQGSVLVPDKSGLRIRAPFFTLLVERVNDPAYLSDLYLRNL